MEFWSELAVTLKPHKLPYFHKGLRAMTLIQSAFLSPRQAISFACLEQRVIGSDRLQIVVFSSLV